MRPECSYVPPNQPKVSQGIPATCRKPSKLFATCRLFVQTSSNEVFQSHNVSFRIYSDLRQHFGWSFWAGDLAFGQAVTFRQGARLTRLFAACQHPPLARRD